MTLLKVVSLRPKGMFSAVFRKKNALYYSDPHPFFFSTNWTDINF